MKRTLNKIYHTAGIMILLYGTLMAVRAAGMADLGADFAEIAHSCMAGMAAILCGAFLEWWQL